MAKTQDDVQAKPTVAESVSAFLHRFRKQIVIVSAVLVAGGIGAAVIMEIQSRRAEDALARAETVQEQYEHWLAADQGERGEIEPGLFAELEAIRDRYSGTYGGLRAQYIEANMHYESERYEAAGMVFEQLAENYPNSHLAPRSLLYAAFAAEELDDPGRAERLFRRLVDSYGADVPEKPRALFGLARIYELGQRYQDAETAYSDLVERYSASPWSNMARNRLIALRAQDRI